MNLVKTFIGRNDLQRITDAIVSVEKKTSGEVRVELRQRRARHERTSSVETLARQAFLELGMAQTAGRTGVLIFLLLEDRQFCIFADEGIHAKVGPDVWTEIASQLSATLHEGKVGDGLVAAVLRVGELLVAHVPRRSDDRNELSNAVSVR